MARHLKPAAPGMKYCPHCKTEHPLDAFSPDARASDGKRAWCRVAESRLRVARRRRAQAKAAA